MEQKYDWRSDEIAVFAFLRHAFGLKCVRVTVTVMYSLRSKKHYHCQDVESHNKEFDRELMRISKPFENTSGCSLTEI
jgi:hypothetical protein